MDSLSFVLLLAAIANLVMGVFVWRHNSKNPVNQAFAEMVLVIALWVLSNYFERLLPIPIVVRSSFAIAAFFPAMLLIFVLAFSEEVGFNRWRFWPLYLACIIFTFLCYTPLVVRDVGGFTSTGIASEMGVLFPAYVVFMIGTLSYGFWKLFSAYRRAAGLRRQQIQYVFLGLGIFSVLAVTTSLLLPLLGDFRFNELDSAASLFFIAFTAYAIVTRQLLNIEVAFNRTVLCFFLIGAIISLNYLFLYYFFRQPAGGPLNTGFFIISSLFIVAIAFLFTSFRQAVSGLVDRIVHHDFYDYEAVITKAEAALVTKLDLAELLGYLAETIRSSMGISKIHVYLAGEDKKSFSRYSLAGYEDIQAFQPDKELILNLPQRKKISFWRKRSRIDPSRADYKEQLFFAENKLEVYLPMIFQEELIGFILLGRKKGGDYSEKDRDLLSALAQQAAVAIVNARLISERQKSIEEFARNRIRAQYAAELEEKNTKLERAYEKLSATQEKLVLAEKLAAISQISLTLQHEINNPLTGIILEECVLSKRLQRDGSLPADFLQQTLTNIKNNATRIKEVIKRLREIERPIVKDYLPGVKMLDLGETDQPD